MILLCDTCSVLMLIRIAPDMFIDDRFECVTINVVCSELIKNPKFKTKYPWYRKYKAKIIPLGATIEDTPSVQTIYKIIHNMIETSEVVNTKTGRLFDLSYTDKKIAACAKALNYTVSTVEYDLTDFLIQQFDLKVFKPLTIINYWLRKDLIKWDDEKHAVLEDWLVCNETSQDKRQIREFIKLTQRKYPGP